MTPSLKTDTEADHGRRLAEIAASARELAEVGGEQALFDHALELMQTLEQRTQEFTDETWAVVDVMQRQFGYSYRELGPWLGWSVEGVRKRLTDYRARRRIAYEPLVGGRPGQ
jgi:DNA-directed RNA polymerase specialized sigma24 family protein